MSKIIITDLTRFSNEEILCTAGIDVDTHKCIRPMPYLKTDWCKKSNILPGTILTGDFSDRNNTEIPHIEDMDCKNLHYDGCCSSNEFKEILSKSAFHSIEEGFAVSLVDDQKCIPREANPKRSLITISVNPDSIKIFQDNYDKIKIHVTDNTGKKFSFLSITDFGLRQYAEKHCSKTSDYSDINNLIQAQEEVFLRIGISQFYKVKNGEAGFWIQVNGIYSFPEYFKAVRQYG